LIYQGSQDAAIDYAHVLKALADPSRLRVFWLLAHIDERICVAEAMAVLKTSHYNASRHLTLLKQAGLVLSQREGRRVFYTLNRSGSQFSLSLLAAVRTIPASEFGQEVQRCQRLLAIRT
jgi:ArsR family transcriptional regulator